MDRRYRCAILVALLIACVSFAGCGGGSKTVPLTIATTTLPDGQAGVAYSARLVASGGTAPYTWSQSSGGDMPGGVNLGSDGVFSGTPTTPGNFGPYVFVVKDAAGTSVSSQSLSIKISGSSLTVTTTALPNGTVGTAYSAPLVATGGTAPYTWTETSGGALPPGLAAVTSGGVIAGTPTTAGAYGPYVFTATDSTNATAASASLTITISASEASVCSPLGNEATLSSANPYAFLVKGTDGNGNPIHIAGSLTPNGAGGITSATVDYNGFTSGPEQLQVNVAGSSYSFGPTAQGCLYLAFSGLATPSATAKRAAAGASRRPTNKTQGRQIKSSVVAATVSGVQFSFDLSGFDGTVYHTGRVIETDNTSGSGTNAAGLIHVQVPSEFALAALPGNYAFGVDGWAAQAQSILRTAMAGTFTNTSGVLSAGYADLNAGGTPSGELSGGYGTFNAAIDAATGRGTGSYFLTTPTGNLIFDFAFYVLNGSDLILISTDLALSNSTTPLLAGRALASNATYGAGALNGYYLLAVQGLEVSGTNTGNLAEIGTINATSAGTIPTATIYSNAAGIFATNQYPNSTYAVEAATGRAGFIGLMPATPVVYLTAGAATDDGIAGFLVGTDTSATSGTLVNQTATAPNYSVASVTGYYAASTAEDVDGFNGAFLGAFTFDGAGGYTVVPQATGSVPNVPGLKTISVNADGSGSLDGGNFPLVTNGNVMFAIPNSGDPLLFVFTANTLP